MAGETATAVGAGAGGINWRNTWGNEAYGAAAGKG